MSRNEALQQQWRLGGVLTNTENGVHVSAELVSKELSFLRKWNKGELRKEMMRIGGLRTKGFGQEISRERSGRDEKKSAHSPSPPETGQTKATRGVGGICNDRTGQRLPRR